MADLDLTALTDKEISALEAALTKRKRNKVDWDNMTDEERAMRNRTLTPVTPERPTPEGPSDPGYYPRTLYGKVGGQVVGPTVASAKEEAELKAKYPDAEWDKTLLEHGIETCPSKPEGHVVAGWQHFGAGKPVQPTDPAVTVMNNPVAPPPLIPDLSGLSRGAKIKAGKAAARARREAA